MPGPSHSNIPPREGPELTLPRQFAIGGTSPFSVEMKTDKLSIFGKLDVEFVKPLGWKPIDGQRQPSTKLGLVSPDFTASLMIAADKLPPGVGLDSIAGGPFIEYLKLGAKATHVIALPISNRDGDSGFMVNAPLIVPGSFIQKPEIRELAMFKHTVVYSKGGYWISFETQSWGEKLDLAKEMAA